MYIELVPKCATLSLFTHLNWVTNAPNNKLVFYLAFLADLLSKQLNIIWNHDFHVENM